MEERDKIRPQDPDELGPDELDSVTGGAGPLGIYKPGFQYKKESLSFFKSCVGDEIFDKAINSEAGRAHHYTVARAFLSQDNWERFVWIEEFGSLKGFPKQ